MKGILGSFIFIFMTLSCATSSLVNIDGTQIEPENISYRGQVTKVPGISSEFLEKNRNLTIYTPQDYENSSDSYPVIYFHDGNNLFTKYSSPGHRWKLEKLLDYLIENGLIPEVIVIGIGNTGNRTAEYVPYVMDDNPSPLADDYLRFIVEELKPQIDADYRTLSDSENTILAGSSYGGLISLYGGLMYPEVFGKILAFSPSLWPAEGAIIAAYEESQQQTNQKYYIDMGGQEHPDAAGFILQTLHWITPFLENRVGAQNLMRVEDPQGVHEEIEWEKRFPDAVVWIFSEAESEEPISEM